MTSTLGVIDGQEAVPPSIPAEPLAGPPPAAAAPDPAYVAAPAADPAPAPDLGPGVTYTPLPATGPPPLPPGHTAAPDGPAVVTDINAIATGAVAVEKGWTTSEGQGFGAALLALFLALLQCIADFGGVVPDAVRTVGIAILPPAAALLVAVYSQARTQRKNSGVSLTR
jgi:hypothetical protein